MLKRLFTLLFKGGIIMEKVLLLEKELEKEFLKDQKNQDHDYIDYLWKMILEK